MVMQHLLSEMSMLVDFPELWDYMKGYRLGRCQEHMHYDILSVIHKCSGKVMKGNGY